MNVEVWKAFSAQLGKFSVEEAVAMQKKRVQESKARGAATFQRRREAAA
jgi:hypothetical protein